MAVTVTVNEACTVMPALVTVQYRPDGGLTVTLTMSPGGGGEGEGGGGGGAPALPPPALPPPALPLLPVPPFPDGDVTVAPGRLALGEGDGWPWLHEPAPDDGGTVPGVAVAQAGAGDVPAFSDNRPAVPAR
jgi:hypothetical protein